MKKLSILLFALSVTPAFATNPPNKVLEKNSLGAIEWPVCAVGNHYCPGVGDEVMFDVYGSGGDGGKAADSIVCPGSTPPGNGIVSFLNFFTTANADLIDYSQACGSGGAGGSAGGFVSVKYTVPANTSAIVVNIGKSTGSSQGASEVSAKISGAITPLATAFAGSVGKSADYTTGGGSGYAYPTTTSSRSTTGPGVSLVTSTNGVNGNSGATASNCGGGAGGIGGGATNGFGAGGKGGNGRSCGGILPTLPSAGGAGRVVMRWYSARVAGIHGSLTFDGPSSAKGSSNTWNLAADCSIYGSASTPSDHCPGYGMPVTVEGWGGGAGGNSGMWASSSKSGAGGDGGNGGGYFKIVYSVPSGNQLITMNGVVGGGGAGGKKTSTLCTSCPQPFGYGSLGGGTNFAIKMNAITQMSYSAAPGYHGLIYANNSTGAAGNVVPNILNNANPGVWGSVTQIDSKSGLTYSSGGTGATCNGGQGGYQSNQTHGFGGKGGNGGFRRTVIPNMTCLAKGMNAGLEDGQPGDTGKITLTW